MSNVIKVTEADFEQEVLRFDLPVLVDCVVGAHPKHTIERALSLEAPAQSAA